MKHVWQRKMIFLEGEFSMGCPLFMYQDTTPSVMGNEKRNASWLKTKSLL